MKKKKALTDQEKIEAYPKLVELLGKTLDALDWEAKDEQWFNEARSSSRSLLITLGERKKKRTPKATPKI